VGAARQWRKARAAGLATLALVAVALPSRAGAPPPGTIFPSLAPLIESIKPAVVTVAVDRPPEAARRGAAPLLDGSIGSGVVVHASRGLILTNAGVLEGAAEVLVVTHDEQSLPARVLGVDRATDLALLEAQADAIADGLVEIRFADADELRVGDYVLAIGNHFGIGKSVTAGIVSALGRRGTSGALTTS
jgi:S1-C subfamily serine protease